MLLEHLAKDRVMLSIFLACPQGVMYLFASELCFFRLAPSGLSLVQEFV